MTETRKLAAILAADVVGYSRLAGADEVASATRPRPGIRSNGGGIDLLRPIGAIAPRRLGCNSAIWNC